MNDVPSRLRAAREQAGLSQGQVARLMDMHRPTISEIEAGRRRVSAEELAEFAKHYGVGVAWLAGGTAESEEVDARVQLAARELASLKKDDLEKVLTLLSRLKATKENGQ